MLSKASGPIPEAKLTIIGKSQSGKSALVTRYVYEEILEPVKTIGVSFVMKVATGGKRQIKLKIWDTAGDERFQALLPTYVRGSHGVLICFSVNDRHSFELVESFLKLTQKECQNNPYIMVIGTKCDESEKRLVAYDEAEAIARGHGCSYIETSAKGNIKVKEAFELAGKELLARSDLEFPKKSQQKSEKSFCSIF